MRPGKGAKRFARNLTSSWSDCHKLRGTLASSILGSNSITVKRPQLFTRLADQRFLSRIDQIDIQNLVPVIIRHRQAITYKNFDQSSFVVHRLDSELLSGINVATQDFEDEIEAQYRSSYPAKFPYFVLKREVIGRQ